MERGNENTSLRKHARCQVSKVQLLVAYYRKLQKSEKGQSKTKEG